jgi:hypothetical protein
MSTGTRNRITWAAGTLYAAAVLASIWAGGLVWVAIIGAILLSVVYTSVRTGRAGAGVGRQRNRNRNRNRERS